MVARIFLLTALVSLSAVGKPINYDRSLVGTRLGYVRRGGEHGISGYDWLWMLDFADAAFADLNQGGAR